MSDLFIFDLGNVIVTNIGILSSIAKELSIPEDILKADYRKYEFSMMAGLFSVEDYYEHLRREYGAIFHDDIFRRHFHPVLNKGIIRLVDRLTAAGGRCAIGSNTFASHWDFIDEMGIRGHFAACYASHLIHAVKPYASFYQAIMAEEGYSPDATHFIDDYGPNVEGARAVGIDAFLYSGDDAALSRHLDSYL